MRYFFVFIFILSAPALATNCIKLKNIQALDRYYEYSFVAKIEEKRKDFSLFKEKYSATIIALNKGELLEKVDIWTTNPTNCGANFEIGKEYVIFANRYKGRLTTHYDSSWGVLDSTAEITDEYREFYRMKKSLP